MLNYINTSAATNKHIEEGKIFADMRSLNYKNKMQCKEIWKFSVWYENINI